MTLNTVFGQSPNDTVINKTKLGTFSINPFEIIFFNPSVYYEKTINNKRYGINFGYMIENTTYNNQYLAYFPLFFPANIVTQLSTNFINISPDRYPICAYNGPELRLYFQCRIDKKRNTKSKFIGPEIFFKYLYYKNHTFGEDVGTSEEQYISYTRDETALVGGIGLTFSKDYYKKNKKISQFNLGLGIRIKFRDINTTSHSGSILYTRALGKKQLQMILPTINFGFRFGKIIKYEKE